MQTPIRPNGASLFSEAFKHRGKILELSAIESAIVYDNLTEVISTEH